MEGYSDSIATLRGQMIFPSRDATTVFRQWTTTNPFCCSHPKYEETKKCFAVSKASGNQKNTAQWGCPKVVWKWFSHHGNKPLFGTSTAPSSAVAPLPWCFCCLLLLPLGHKSTHSSASTNFPQRKKTGRTIVTKQRDFEGKMLEEHILVTSRQEGWSGNIWNMDGSNMDLILLNGLVQYKTTYNFDVDPRF